MSVIALDVWPKVDRAADILGYVTAYRNWTLISNQGRYRLSSCGLVGRNCIWPARKPLEARCYRVTHDEPLACAERCKNNWRLGRCGIYGLKSMEDRMFQSILSHPRSYSISVLGAVALWGVVLEHERGFRAQYASPLWLTKKVGPKHALREIERDYGIPLREEWVEP